MIPALLELFSILAALHGLWDLSSPTRDQTLSPAVEAQSPNPWKSLGAYVLMGEESNIQERVFQIMQARGRQARKGDGCGRRWRREGT